MKNTALKNKKLKNKAKNNEKNKEKNNEKNKLQKIYFDI